MATLSTSASRSYPNRAPSPSPELSVTDRITCDRELGLTQDLTVSHVGIYVYHFTTPTISVHYVTASVNLHSWVLSRKIWLTTLSRVNIQHSCLFFSIEEHFSLRKVRVVSHILLKFEIIWRKIGQVNILRNYVRFGEISIIITIEIKRWKVLNPYNLYREFNARKIRAISSISNLKNKFENSVRTPD